MKVSATLIGITADRLSIYSQTQQAILALAQRTFALPAISKTPHRNGMVVSLTQRRQQKLGESSKGLGRPLAPSKRQWTSSATAVCLSYRPLVICQEISARRPTSARECGFSSVATAAIQGKSASSASGKAAHALDREILDGKCEIAVFTLPNGMKMSLQADIPAAKDTINRIRELEQLGVHIALAHDAQWIKKGSDHVLMGMFDEKIKQTAVEKIVNDERP